MRIAGRVSLCNGMRIYQSRSGGALEQDLPLRNRMALGALLALKIIKLLLREAGSFTVAVETNLAQTAEPRQRNGLVAVRVLAFVGGRRPTTSVCSAHHSLFRRRSRS